MSLYNLRISGPDWTVTKFDDDLNVESTYKILNGGAVCECPAGVRPTCRHRQMLPQLMERIDTNWFLDFDSRSWVAPLRVDDMTASEASLLGQTYAYSEEDCPGHVASDNDSKVCGRCGVHIDSFRPDDEGPQGSLGSSQPHSTTVSAADFESVDEGSSPSVAAKPVMMPDTHPFRRRM